jgi:hypothetical protein
VGVVARGCGGGRQAGVGRKFIYDHLDLRTEIELKAVQATRHQVNNMLTAAHVIGASLRADLENSRAQNRRLQQQIRPSSTGLPARRRPPPQRRPTARSRGHTARRSATRRISQLEQQLFEATEALRRTTEELEAARNINRELMQRANRQHDELPPSRPRRRP